MRPFTPALQLRLLRPSEVAARVLEQRPQAYYEADGKSDFEELYGGAGVGLGQGLVG